MTCYINIKNFMFSKKMFKGLIALYNKYFFYYIYNFMYLGIVEYLFIRTN